MGPSGYQRNVARHPLILISPPRSPALLSESCKTTFQGTMDATVAASVCDGKYWLPSSRERT